MNSALRWLNTIYDDVVVLRQVNVILVIHPRKEEDGSALGISSICGTAKVTYIAVATAIAAPVVLSGQ